MAVSETDIMDNKLNERHHRLYKYHSYLKEKKSIKLEARIDEVHDSFEINLIL